MSNSATPQSRKVKIARNLFMVCGPSAILVGLAMLAFPINFWGLIGIEAGLDAVVASLYGSVLIGVGIVSLAGVIEPERHLSLLLLVGSYKLVASVILAVRCGQLLVNQAAPVAGFMIAGAYFFMAAICLGLYFLPENQR